MAFRVPPTAKPEGKSSLASWQTAPGPSSSAAFRQSSCSFAFSRPAMETMPWSFASAASCMASPRSFTRRRPSSKVKTPAAQRAVYSPKERPAMTAHRVTASSRSVRSFSRPARPARNIAGWQYLVSSNFSSGPCRQISRMSYPKMSLAWSIISLTLGKSLTPESIFTYCEPCPGKRSATGSGASPFGPTFVGFGAAAFGFLSVFTTSSLAVMRMATQPCSGPEPSTRR
mmetsp:Transcript_10645/g.30320  ORF Transcript_10645/g.30320 Transcript_10645/m.30320 type:complete len:229 (+) Transcript_10645:571-1257(+)